MDLLLVSASFAKISFPRRLMEIEEMWDERLQLEVLPYSEDEFKRARKRSYVVREALRHGVEI